ncbi:MAG: nucleotidyl transferase AbiEii/AbiGii toxin family protein [Anaerolineae bacterium]
MAALDPVYWEAITPQMRDLLRFIGQQPFAQRFYLAGGTALALRLGHRRSVDLDFFSTTDRVMRETRLEILHALAPHSPQALEDVDGNLLLQVPDLHVGFFSYSYSLLEPTDSVEGVVVASIVDVGLMKLDALITRGSRKDFYDLYAIAQEISVPDLLAVAGNKYPYVRDFELMAIESLVLFDNADRDVQPDLLIDLPWEQVRQSFVDLARDFGESWFGDQQG